VSTKPTLLLLAAAVLLFAFVFFVDRPRQAALVPPNYKVLPALDPAKISAIEIHVGGGAHIIRAEKTNQVNTNQAKTNQLWQLTKPNPYPASGELIEELLQELSLWEWQTSIDRPSSWEEYGLGQDPLFALILQESGQDRILEIGHISPVGDKVYLNVRGSDQVLVAGTNVLNWIPTNQLLWRDSTVLDLVDTPFQKLEVRSTNWNFDLDFDPATRLWRMTKPLEARADTPRINQWLGSLQTMRVRQFILDEAQALNVTGVPGPPPTGQLVLTFLRDSTESNKVLELQVGDSPGGPTNRLTNFAYARRLQPPGLIVIDKAPLLPWEGDYTNFLDRHLLGVSPDLISSIEVTGSNLESFTVQKTVESDWHITTAGGLSFPADPMLMNNWFSNMTSIQVEIGRSVVADKAPYGLDNPLLHYRLFSAGAAGQTNPPLAEMLFGLGTNQTDKIFEMGGDGKYVNSIDPGHFDLLPGAFWQLRDLAIWHFDSNDVVAIEVRSREGIYRYTRDARNQWTLPAGVDLRVDQSKVEETLSGLGRLRAIYWSGYGDDNLEQYGFGETGRQIALEINRGDRMETNIIQFGKTSPRIHIHPYASVMRDGHRLIFEFPVDLYANKVLIYLGFPLVYRPTF
jgi:hypothetical protein